ncbi:hypothetical protein F5Y06DRAFT_290532 [Hypoxylon sp. FL0890]|nr:hypothetical protein F5Y06DRAFT_290532 [Hypoxylon sp. FL0890]
MHLPLRTVAPIPNPGQLFAIIELITNAKREILAHCDRLNLAYHQTGDATWLQRRTLTLQQSAAHFEAMAVHLEQCRRTIQAALELQGPQATNGAHLNPGPPVGQGVLVRQEGLIAQDAPIDQAMPVQDAPINPGTPDAVHGQNHAHEQNALIVANEERRGASEPQRSSDGRILYCWENGTMLRFTLTYAGPPEPPPKVFLGWQGEGYHANNGWIIEGWSPRHGGVNEKGYVIRATPGNVNMIRQAYSYLRAYKSDLEDPRYVPSTVFDALPLELIIIPACTNQLNPCTGKLLIRDINSNGKVEIRSPLTGLKIEEEDIGENALIYWIEEATLRIFFNLYHDLKNEVDKRNASHSDHHH